MTLRQRAVLIAVLQYLGWLLVIGVTLAVVVLGSVRLASFRYMGF